VQELTKRERRDVEVGRGDAKPLWLSRSGKLSSEDVFRFSFLFFLFYFSSCSSRLFEN